MWFSCIRVLPGRAEAQLIWGVILKCLLIAYFISNISAKKISKSIHVRQSYSKPKVGRFFETRCRKVSNKYSGLPSHSRSLVFVPFDRPHYDSCWSSIVTVSHSCTVSEIISLIYQNLKRSRDPEHTSIGDVLLCCASTDRKVLSWLSVWSKVQMICIWSSWWHCHPIVSCVS